MEKLGSSEKSSKDVQGNLTPIGCRKTLPSFLVDAQLRQQFQKTEGKHLIESSLRLNV